MPESDQAPSLPFKFTGGFGLATKTIGYILSFQGLLQMLVQVFVFPVINRRFGSLALFRVSICVYPILYFLVPYLALLPKGLRFFGIFWLLLFKVSTQAFTYPSLQIMLANHSPSKKILGTLNGSAASSASLCRAFGPTVSGFIQTRGLSLGYSGLPWWVCSLIAITGVTESLWMTASKRREQDTNLIDDGPDEESVLVEHPIDPNGPPIISEDALLQQRRSTDKLLKYGSVVEPVKSG